MIKHKMVKPYMHAARGFAQLSHAERKKVGYVAITPQDIMIYSWNGRPSGDDNNCEIAVPRYDGHWGVQTGVNIVTHPECLHAERNIIAKAAREGISLKGATLVGTLSPCLECALQMHQVGVESVIYEEEYRLTDGIEYLRRKGIHCEKYEEE
ncbi:cytidine deaminase [Pseudomonas phage phiPMW]|uniref:Cytidine deaminase n=1 Tax=Pseudomonas phage phiPMW TaxID=1815582 RepID=A0A1S5R1F6_9CAUD|nr:cytidine deaminase [Pseudomonas phage phiPMW]ANA49217.1 cytidine deaminase [Pseudomonas phage phiPMW]